MSKSPMLFSVRQVRLDRGGYDSRGRYFGTGEPLWRYTSECGEVDSYLRAWTRADALAQVSRLHPGARFYRGVSAKDAGPKGPSATRYCGQATIRVEYDERETSRQNDGRCYYRGTVSIPGHKPWAFSELGSGVGGFRGGCDCAEAFDAIAASAVSFGCHQESGPDAPDWLAPEGFAYDLANAVDYADDSGSYAIRRTRSGPVRKAS